MAWDRSPRLDATLEAINELALRKLLLQKLSQKELLLRLLEPILAAELPWEERRAYWSYLFLSQHFSTLATTLEEALKSKQRVPFDLLIAVGNMSGGKPKPVILEALLKGLRKQGAVEEIFAARAWDKWDPRLAPLRQEQLDKKIEAKKRFKEELLEKFWFMHSQRMVEEARRTLLRLTQLFPEDEEIAKIKRDQEEQWARDVLSTHLATLTHQRVERAQGPSAADQSMIAAFRSAGEKLCLEKREVAEPLTYALVFMEEYDTALDILSLASPTPANEWLKAELLVLSRRFVEGLEFVNSLEVRFVEDPETTFAVSYLRARCLNGLGQQGPAIEILQSIVRVRANYRSAHSLILEWTEGVGWE